MLLALDTATAFASVALYDGREVRAELNWRSERRHTVELAPQVDNLMQLAGVSPAHLHAVAVAIGPGSYTGTRIALSFAKGIVLALDIPLIGIPTLDVLAYPMLPASKPVCALVAAGRKRYCWAVYAANRPLPERVTPFGLHHFPEIMSQVQSPAMWVGELQPIDKEALIAEWQDGVHILPPALAVRRGAVLAELAWQRLLAGNVDDPVSLSPIYLG